MVQSIQSEIQRQQSESRFQIVPSQRHTHNGTDSPPVSYLSLSQIQFAVTSVVPGASASTQANYGPFYVATAGCTIQAMYETHTVNSSASPTHLFVEILRAGQTSGSGTPVQEFDMTTGANLISSSVLLPGDLGAVLNAGDRLSLFMAQAPTALVQVTVTVLLQFNSNNNL